MVQKPYFFCVKYSREINYVIYQIVFLLALASLWNLGIWSYVTSLPPFEPRYQNFDRNPGMSFRPRPENIHSTLIQFRHGGSGNWQSLMDRFLDFIKAYGFGKRPGGIVQCNWSTKIGRNERCTVAPIKWWALDTDVPCTAPEKFGMFHGRPCVIVKLNKIYGWEPEPYYNITEINDHPEMPLQLKHHINTIWSKQCEGKGKLLEERCPHLRMAWISCEGETESDVENLGRVSYTPKQGFPGYYYPYLNQMHYLSPLTFLQFRDITPGVLIQIRCRAWAKNIKHDERNNRVGGVHFEMLMD